MASFHLVPRRCLITKGLKLSISSCLSSAPSSIGISSTGFGISSRCISSGEVFTALKPFFFVVHPDLFGQFPKERAVNENSLKQLNAYIESATQSQTKSVNPVNLTFYLRQNQKAEPTKATNDNQASTFQAVKIDLGKLDVRRTVYSILEMCNLPTSFMDSIPTSQWDDSQLRSSAKKRTYYPNSSGSFWKRYEDDFYAKAERELAEKKLAQEDLITWLRQHAEEARAKLVNCHPVREEVVRLKNAISKSLDLKDVVSECEWSVTHFRGCLESFQTLVSQHTDVMKVLKGRVLVFGHETGVSMDGHVVLNSGEVRKNWLDTIKNVSKHDAVILRIPSVQRALSRSLKDIKVVHRKFQPNKMAEKYEAQLRKLTTSLGDYRGTSNFPKDWPEELSHLELVVETDAGPLMVSPTGQIIVPSSCPPFLLVNFISSNMEDAKNKLYQYKRQKYEEKDLHAKCISTFGLVGLDKADNVTPDLMIDCCRRLLSHRPPLAPILKGSHLWITTYYSVLLGGELCIPWNWKEPNNSV